MLFISRIGWDGTGISGRYLVHCCTSSLCCLGFETDDHHGNPNIQRSSGPARPTLRSTSQGRVNTISTSAHSPNSYFFHLTPRVCTSHICRAHSTAFPTFPPTPFSHLRPPFPSRLGVRAGRRGGKRLLISSGSTGEETNRAR